MGTGHRQTSLRSRQDHVNIKCQPGSQRNKAPGEGERKWVVYFLGKRNGRLSLQPRLVKVA